MSLIFRASDPLPPKCRSLSMLQKVLQLLVLPMFARCAVPRFNRDQIDYGGKKILGAPIDKRHGLFAKRPVPERKL